jgi:hypothetical protein
MAVTWNDIAFVLDPALAEEVQSAWSWLVPDPWRPLVCSMVGGLFFETDGGEVRWLETGTGLVENVAANAETFEAMLRAGEPIVEEWFLPGLVEALHQAGKRPGPGECYCFIVPPVFAEGRYEADNMAVVPVREQFVGMAGIHRQIWGLPHGAKVHVKVVD